MTSASPQLARIDESLRFYIVRGNEMVPLVPADQLPCELEGVPRQLSHRQREAGQWRFVDHDEKSHGPACIIPMIDTESVANRESESFKTEPNFFAPDHQVRKNASTPTKKESATPHSPIIGTKMQSNMSRASLQADRSLSGRPLATTANESSTYPIDLEALAKTSGFKSASYPQASSRLGSRPLPPSGIEPDYSKKEYCTHWIQTNECSFMKTGCRFKHEMPSLEVLKELGFNQYPRWWRDKTAIKRREKTWLEKRTSEQQSLDVCDASPGRGHLPRTSGESMERRNESYISRDLPNSLDRGHFNDGKDDKAMYIALSNDNTTHEIPNLIDMDEPPTDPLPSTLSAGSITQPSTESRPSCTKSPPTSVLPRSNKRANKKAKEIKMFNDRSVYQKLQVPESLESWKDMKARKIVAEVSALGGLDVPLKASSSQQLGLCRSKHADTNDQKKIITPCPPASIETKDHGKAVRENSTRVKSKVSDKPPHDKEVSSVRRQFDQKERHTLGKSSGKN